MVGFGHILSRESTIYWLSILVRVNVLSTDIGINGMDSQDDQKVEAYSKRSVDRRNPKF